MPDTPPSPYTPPSASLIPPALPARTGMSFGKRLMLTPVWFALASIPVLVLLAVLNNFGRGTGLEWICVPVVLVAAYFIYRWLMRGLGWPEEKIKAWIWLGVPLVVMAWGAVLLGGFFAVCAVIMSGNGWH